MTAPDETGSTREFEQALEDASDANYVLRLYVSGATPRSIRAIANLRALCDAHLAGRFAIQVVDIYQEPQLAMDEDILASPTLVKVLPLPTRRVVGDLSERDWVLAALGLRMD